MDSLKASGSLIPMPLQISNMGSITGLDTSSLSVLQSDTRVKIIEHNGLDNLYK
jgi:hypothetical protein